MVDRVIRDFEEDMLEFPQEGDSNRIVERIMRTQRGEMETARKKPSECPKCNSKKIAEILYGIVDYEDVKDELEAEQIVLGGCVQEIGGPVWQCTNCNEEIYYQKK